MRLIAVHNVHDALPRGIEQLLHHGVEEQTRNGPVLSFPQPVTTRYSSPTERVIFWPQRDANPFFHFMEGLWMLAGRDDVAFLEQYTKNMRRYSDDGVTLHGAYGFRWRHAFSFDQIVSSIDKLRADPTDRRVLITMWDPLVDTARAEQGGKDVPCNTHVYLRVVGGALDMTVCCRSNDMIWGAYGANAVHFSMLQEFIASALGMPVGVYYQISNNMHAYVDVLEKIRPLADCAPDPFSTVKSNPYYEMGQHTRPYPMVSTPWEQWLQELEMFVDEGPAMGFQDPFFRSVASPIASAHRAYKSIEGAGRYIAALDELKRCKSWDWRRACEQWIQRRKAKFLEGPPS